ncbi:hypothetical protein [Agromyces sp. Soil535]|uniref:hypothetical protein n=1 Tax=Agromyces sp. Soil535 TaxID=1736390 RepID=UPI0006F273FB|nr:hypothetical protein [Agromyces sp. Soil535]KRE30808.1 hypothetical protein ASG80_16245 [Agromyces sp. Soil535]
MEPAAFDVREFARTAQGSLRDDLDLTRYAAAPLRGDVVRVLDALAVLEGATMAHLRNVLVTPTHKDARVTAFLVTWAYEKFWIADALRAIVAANGGAPRGWSGAASDAGTHRRAASAGRGPVRRALAGFAQGWPVIGVHMTVGLVDDWMLRAAYERVARASANDALDAVLRRILDVKERHTRFFQEEASRRLAASPKAAGLARRELARTVWPLGSTVLGRDDRDDLVRFVFGGSEGDVLAARLERDIADLPGLDRRAAASVLRGLAGGPAA